MGRISQGSGIVAWVRIARLHFYPMTAIAYSMGALSMRSVKVGFSAALLLGLLLGLGYTAPPLAFSRRGIGELDVSFTHGPFSLLFGYLMQGGGWTAPAPWLLAVPFFLSVFQAILLAGLPDRKTDAEAGKRTLAVRWGPRATVALSLCALLVSIPALAGLWALGILRAVPPPLLLAVGLHAVLLTVLLARYLREGAHDGRIDTILMVSLGYIAWPGALPLIDFLLRSAAR